MVTLPVCLLDESIPLGAVGQPESGKPSSQDLPQYFFLRSKSLCAAPYSPEVKLSSQRVLLTKEAVQMVSSKNVFGETVTPPVPPSQTLKSHSIY
jgi:hypothetical protein